MRDAPDFAEHFVRGIERFNNGQFWEAHEEWEQLWLEATTEVSQFLQGLIQLAAAYHHVQRGTIRGAGRLFDAALERLRPFPPGYCGVAREELVETAAAERHRVYEALSRGNAPEPLVGKPAIELQPGWEDKVPPELNW